jgi:translation initiation factor IF-2
MTKNNTELIGDNQIHLLDELQTLLEKQIELARQGNITEVEILSEQAGSLVEEITQTGILDPAGPVFNGQQQEQLRKVYKDLCLAITDQKMEVSKELSRVRKGKKTIQTYRSHI